LATRFSPRAQQGDFIAIGVDQAGAHAPDGFNLRHEIVAFLRIGSPFGFALKRVDGWARQRSDPGVGEKNALLRDGKEAMAERLIGQNVVDAEIDVVSMLFHPSSFTQIAEKASLMEGRAPARPWTTGRSSLQD
jgi:hypothetical protein